MPRTILYTGICVFMLMGPVSLVFADTLILKSGESIECKVIEQTKDYVKIEYEGIPLTYAASEIKDVKRTEMPPEQKPASLEPSAMNAIVKSKGEDVPQEDCLKGIKFYEEKIKSDSSSADAYFNLGVYYYWTGKFEDAISNLKKAISLNLQPQYLPPAHILVGLSYRALGMQAEARRDFLEANESFRNMAKTGLEYLRAYVSRKIIEYLTGSPN